MAVTERFSEKIKKIQEGRSGQVIASLITQERTQKLDLLVHLITNLKQSLIICGPKGIGKTTLLTIFQERTASAWPIVYLSATELLSFEKIQEHLLRGLTPSVGGSVAQNLNTILHGLEKLNRRVVLIIDDAGLLVPGLMTTLTQYAVTYPCLRVVFALSDDELLAKRGADSTVDACHFIEIPALSETQCGEFLHHLSGQLDERQVMDDMADGVARVKMPKINAALNEQVYKQTKGIPGKIAEALPSLTPIKNVQGLNWRYVLPAAGIVTLVTGLLVANFSGTPEQAANTAAHPGAVATASLSIPGQTAPEPEPEPTEAEAIEAKQAAKPLVPETLPKPDPYKGFVRAREGDSLDDFKADAQKTVPQNIAAEQVDVKIMPSEPPIEVAAASQMPAVPTGMAEADMAIAEVTPENKPTLQAPNKGDKPAIKAPTPAPVVAMPAPVKPVTEDKAAVEAEKQAKILKIKESEAKKLLDAQKKLLLVKKQKAEALEKIKLKQKALAEKEASKIAEFSKQKIELPEVVEPKLEPAVKRDALKAKQKAKEETLVKPKNPTVVEAKPIVAPVAKIKSADPGNIKTIETDAKPKTITAKILKDTAAQPESIAAKPSSSHYTLQVMSFTQAALVEAFMRKHSAMGAGLRTITINSGSNPKYIVVYGSFDSNAQANAAKQKLPADFRQAFARKM